MTTRDAGYGEYEDGIDADEEFDEDLLDEEPEPEPDYADADAFFAAEVEDVQPAVIRLFDVDYTLPPRVPFTFNLLLARHSDDESIESFGKVLAPLFGEGTLQLWLDKGIDERQLSIVLAWSIANIKVPGILSLPEAAKKFDEEQARAVAEGKARNRAERRARPTTGSGARSSSTGRTSKRTSAARTS